MQENQHHSTRERRQPEPVSLGRLLSLLGGEFRLRRLRLLAGFAALLGVDFLQLIIPRILKHGVDSLTDSTATTGLLLKLGGLIIAIALVVVLLRFCWRNLIIGFSRHLERRLRNRIFNHIMTMDQIFFERRTTGDIMAHASNDLTAVQMACGMGMVAAVDALVLSLAAIGFMLHIHQGLTLLALLPMPLLAISTRLLSGKLHQRFNTVQEQFALLTEFARSSLISIRLSKAYTLEGLQSARFDRLGQTYAAANIRVALVQGLLFPAATLIGNLGLLAILVYGGRLVVENRISMGDFVAFITYLQMLIWPMMAVGWVTNLLQRGITALRRIYILVTAEPQLRDRPPLPLRNPLHPTLEARRLSFGYPQSNSQVLQDLDFSVKSGIIGIAGPTGSGKTTLCRLLLRLYPVADGTLFFGGFDVNRLSLDQVRSQIAYVGQEPVLFSDSIGNNIGLGRPQASEEEIAKAAREADLAADIESFPDGYQTLVGERGITLSGGQRQRLALARALLCDRPVLVIDDGLSAVDTATEAKIVETLQHSLGGKTVCIVSNRVKLLSLTDRILLLEQGRLVATGSHRQLVARNDFYREMNHKQMQSGSLGNSDA